MSKTIKTEAEVEVQEAVIVKTAEDIIKEHGGVSKAIRALAADPNYIKDGKVNRGLIATTLNKRYQHVRNVLTTEPKKSA